MLWGEVDWCAENSHSLSFICLLIILTNRLAPPFNNLPSSTLLAAATLTVSRSDFYSFHKYCFLHDIYGRLFAHRTFLSAYRLLAGPHVRWVIGQLEIDTQLRSLSIWLGRKWQDSLRSIAFVPAAPQLMTAGQTYYLSWLFLLACLPGTGKSPVSKAIGPV